MTNTTRAVYPRTVHTGGSQRLAKNDIWNIPARGTDEVRLDIVCAGMWQTIKTVRGLAIDRDGTVYGVRALTNVKESGYHLEGQVSIGGRKYRAFTSGALFEREDGSLCSVAVLYVQKDSLPKLPNLDTADDSFLAELSHRYFYSDKKETRGHLYEYVRSLQILRSNEYPHMAEHYRQVMADAYDALPLSLKFKG